MKLNNKGSSLIELIIAVMIVGLIVTAVAVASTYSIKNTGEARFRQVATTLGQEVIEMLRSEKNRLGFINFNNALVAATYCFDDPLISDFGTANSDLNNAAGACGVDDTVTVAGGTFTRQAAISQAGGITTVDVTVTWDDSGSPRTVDLTQEFKDANTSF